MTLSMWTPTVMGGVRHDPLTDNTTGSTKHRQHQLPFRKRTPITMGLLDVQVPQLTSSEASFADQAAMMRSTIHSAESAAMQAQAFHMGESATAFQGAHARFVEASQKINTLLDIASANLGENAGTYVAEDAAGASNITGAAGNLPA